MISFCGSLSLRGLIESRLEVEKLEAFSARTWNAKQNRLWSRLKLIWYIIKGSNKIDCWKFRLQSSLTRWAATWFLINSCHWSILLRLCSPERNPKREAFLAAYKFQLIKLIRQPSRLNMILNMIQSKFFNGIEYILDAFKLRSDFFFCCIQIFKSLAAAGFLQPCFCDSRCTRILKLISNPVDVSMNDFWMADRVAHRECIVGSIDWMADTPLVA